jgi:hypothetical protein
MCETIKYRATEALITQLQPNILSLLDYSRATIVSYDKVDIKGSSVIV